MSAHNVLPVDRFLSTLAIVAKEARHLEWSRARLFAQKIDAARVDSLAPQPGLAERLEAKANYLVNDAFGNPVMRQPMFVERFLAIAATGKCRARAAMDQHPTRGDLREGFVPGCEGFHNGPDLADTIRPERQ